MLHIPSLLLVKAPYLSARVHFFLASHVKLSLQCQKRR